MVMLTANPERANVEHAIAAGVFSYLVKPFRETDVIPAVRAAVVLRVAQKDDGALDARGAADV
jgi:AmiR/NasT family two-component response regulator